MLFIQIFQNSMIYSFELVNSQLFSDYPKKYDSHDSIALQYSQTLLILPAPLFLTIPSGSVTRPLPMCP
jgi:hypothetical protein